MVIIAVAARQHRAIPREAPVPGWTHAIPFMTGIAAAAVPAHGFVVGARGLVSVAAVRQVTAGPAFTWLKKFLVACLWASMIAGGMLIYTHFTSKWQAKGYPVIPINALTTLPDQLGTNQQRIGQAIPLGAGGTVHTVAGNAQRKEQPKQTSFLDEYEG